MTFELDPAALDAISKARRVKRRAELRDRASGRWTWRSVVAGICIVAGWWLWSRWLDARHIDLGLVPLIAFLSVAGSLAEARTSRRLDAILELLDEGEADRSGRAA